MKHQSERTDSRRKPRFPRLQLMLQKRRDEERCRRDQVFCDSVWSDE